ncbi:Cdc6/Cdc18 family protein [Halobacterium wangiae]|uniref:Cdc6/Cdc18 family protein n=1 Tax=Halobacterium wangiae TaxID=2902623 RepID=UPI001E314945|nr:Cdc6/Cdc18 family protein [Halobacterium wangiae]
MITHPHVFDEGWVPEDLHARDGETTALASAFSPITNGEAPNPVLLSGPPGAGKTATSRWVLQELDEETAVRTALVDCWTNHRPYQAYTAILQGLGRPGVVQPKTPQTALRSRVRSALPDSGCVIVLDEADQLDDPHLIADLNAMDGVGVVTIVNDEDRFRDRLRRESVSIEWTENIPYGPYSQDALVGILQPRAVRGLESWAYTTRDLEEVAALANGNAREAIQTLRAAVDAARASDQEELTSGVIEAGRETAINRIRQKARSRLQRHERIVLEVLEELGESAKSRIYEEYEQRVGEEEARTPRRVGDYLSKLESYNQVVSAGETRGRTYRAVTDARDSRILGH